MCSVCDSTGWVHLDAADAITISVVGDLDVAVVTPGCGPRVLDDVVVLAVFAAIADGEDTVVKLSSALWTVHNSSLVELEDQLVGLDGDGGWCDGDRGHE